MLVWGALLSHHHIPIQRQSVEQMVENQVLDLPERTYQVCRFVIKKASIRTLEKINKDGFVRVQWMAQICSVTEVPELAKNTSTISTSWWAGRRQG